MTRASIINNKTQQSVVQRQFLLIFLIIVSFSTLTTAATTSQSLSQLVNLIPFDVSIVLVTDSKNRVTTVDTKRVTTLVTKDLTVYIQNISSSLHVLEQIILEPIHNIESRQKLTTKNLYKTTFKGVSIWKNNINATTIPDATTVAGYEVSCLATARPRLLTSFTNENGAASGLGLTVVDVSAKINPNLYTTKTNNDSYGDGLDVVLAICIASTAMILLIFPCLMAWHENRQYTTKSSERTTLQVKISRMCLKLSRQFTCFLALLLAFTYVFLFRHFQMLGPISSTASINTQISALTLLSNVSNKEMTLHPSHQTALFRKKDVMNLSIDCTWSPTLEQPCLSLLSKRLKFVKRIREWIYFGDSTMAGTFKHMAETCLNHLKSKGINCTSSKASRCKNNEFYGLSIKENWSWVPPSEFEGPKTNGVKFPNCMDCSTCFTNIWNCNNPSNKMPSFYGVEFATGQETVCILNVGLHDMALLTLTDLKFYENIMWYFSLLDPVCAHFVWVHSTLLRDDKIEPFCPNQTNPRIRKWNRVVSQMLSKSPQFQSKTTIVDVEEASKNFPHNDRVHLKYLWYKALGGLFYKLYNQRM